MFVLLLLLFNLICCTNKFAVKADRWYTRDLYQIQLSSNILRVAIHSLHLSLHLSGGRYFIMLLYILLFDLITLQFFNSYLEIKISSTFSFSRYVKSMETASGFHNSVEFSGISTSCQIKKRSTEVYLKSDLQFIKQIHYLSNRWYSSHF